MPTLSHITDHVDYGLDKLLGQYKGKPRIEELLSIFLERVQGLEDLLWDLVIDRALLTATGEQLDGIGEIVGQQRGDKSDGVYVLWIKARIIVNRSVGNIPTLNKIIDTLLFSNASHIRDFPPASFEFHAIDCSYPRDCYLLAKDARPAAVQMLFTYTAWEEDFTFTSSSDWDLGAEILVDGSMDLPNTVNWAVSGGVLSKVFGDPYEGSRTLKLQRNAAVAYPYGTPVVNPFVVGQRYRIKGYVRADSSAYPPRVYSNAGADIWVGNNYPGWQTVDVSWIATGAALRLGIFGGSSASDFVEFDGFSVKLATEAAAPTIDADHGAGTLHSIGASLVADGDMEAAGVGSWTSLGGAVLAKQGGAYEGDQCLRVTAGVGSYPSAAQNILAASTQYVIEGYARSDGVALPVVTNDGVTPYLFWWVGTNAAVWQPFRLLVETGAPTLFQLIADVSGGGAFCEFDLVACYPYSELSTPADGGRSAGAFAP